MKCNFTSAPYLWLPAAAVKEKRSCIPRSAAPTPAPFAAETPPLLRPRPPVRACHLEAEELGSPVILLLPSRPLRLRLTVRSVVRSPVLTGQSKLAWSGPAPLLLLVWKPYLSSDNSTFFRQFCAEQSNPTGPVPPGSTPSSLTGTSIRVSLLNLVCVFLHPSVTSAKNCGVHYAWF